MADALAVLRYKTDIDREVLHVLASYRNSSSQLSWSNDAIDRLTRFVTAGKSIRGSLMVYTYRMFKSETLPSILKAAVAIELIHAGLLIHDDIMDRDQLRRSLPSIYTQYEEFGREHGARNAAQFGDSQAINLGDVCFFLGFSLLDIHSFGMSADIAHELSFVALAQMQDVSAGELPNRLSREQIRSVYQYKTARYTFSLPLKVGAMLAHAPDSVVRNLFAIGEHIGLLYQIRDDELNDTGHARTTGKTTGSDTKNGKQTLAHSMSVDEMIALKKDSEDRARTLIQGLPLWADQKTGLLELVTFVSSRDK